MPARYLVADVFDGLATLDDSTVDLVVTSPPFLALRSYLPADHPDKGKEIGSEPTPAAFLDVMLAVTAELRRVLAPHGSICIEFGDTYSGGDTTFRQFKDAPQDEIAAGNHLVQYGDHPMGAIRNMNNKIQPSGPGWPLSKCKAMIPELYRIALAYGINPLTGQASPAGRWRVRNNVTWCRPNPPVGALGDKWRPATSDVVVACVSDKRYWDDIATRGPYKPSMQRLIEKGDGRYKNKPDQQAGIGSDWTNKEGFVGKDRGGAPLLDYWEIPPGGYPGSHYAVFPPALVEPLVKAMAPPKVCRTCGEPSRRIVGDSDRYADRKRTHTWQSGGLEKGHAKPASSVGWEDGSPVVAEHTTLGWTDCDHDDWRPALILDPFGGSGTVGQVATGHGHDCILIDLDERNAVLAEERIGPFLFQRETLEHR